MYRNRTRTSAYLKLYNIIRVYVLSIIIIAPVVKPTRDFNFPKHHHIEIKYML